MPLSSRKICTHLWSTLISTLGVASDNSRCHRKRATVYGVPLVGRVDYQTIQSTVTMSEIIEMEDLDAGRLEAERQRSRHPEPEPEPEPFIECSKGIYLFVSFLIGFLILKSINLKSDVCQGMLEPPTMAAKTIASLDNRVNISMTGMFRMYTEGLGPHTSPRVAYLGFSPTNVKYEESKDGNVIIELEDRCSNARINFTRDIKGGKLHLVEVQIRTSARENKFSYVDPKWISFDLANHYSCDRQLKIRGKFTGSKAPRGPVYVALIIDRIEFELNGSPDGKNTRSICELNKS